MTGLLEERPIESRWSPIGQMETFLETRGYIAEAGNVVEAWAAACEDRFILRNPLLAGQVWDDIWEAIPFGGNLLWVVSVKPDEKIGTIAIPESVKLTNEEGWVLSVGWGICEPETNSGRCCLYENPLDFVGRRIFWSRYAGVDLGVNAWGSPRHDADGNEIPERNRPKLFGNRSQYSQIRIGDVYGLSFKAGGSIL